MITFTLAAKQFGRFFAWWGGELVGMLPGWIAGGGANVNPIHTVCVDVDGFRLCDTDGGGPLEERQIMTGPAIAAQLASVQRAKGPVTVGLRIPFAYCFGRSAELPSAAEKDFSRLLALDMERATPFRTAEVYSAFVIMPQVVARPGKTTVRQIIVKRSLLVGAVAELERAGLRTGRIDCWDETGRTPLKIDFLGAEPGYAPREWSLVRHIAVASVFATLLAVWGASATLTNLRASLARLNAQAQGFRAVAASQQASKEAAKAAQSTLAALEALATSPPAKLDIIDEITQLLPDSAWVSDLRVSTDGVDISGFAKSTVALLPLLEKSPLFMDATSAAAVTFDPREDKERFSLHVRYRPSAAAQSQLDDAHR